MKAKLDAILDFFMVLIAYMEGEALPCEYSNGESL